VSDHLEFSPEEKEQLAVSVRKGVAAIAELWDTLTRIGERVGAEWEPTLETGSVSDILNNMAVGCNEPGQAESITADEAAEAFASRGDWQS